MFTGKDMRIINDIPFKVLIAGCMTGPFLLGKAYSEKPFLSLCLLVVIIAFVLVALILRKRSGK